MEFYSAVGLGVIRPKAGRPGAGRLSSLLLSSVHAGGMEACVNQFACDLCTTVQICFLAIHSACFYSGWKLARPRQTGVSCIH